MRQRTSHSRAGAVAVAALASLLVVPSPASAHVSVVPDRIETSSRTTLTLVAPGEHDLPMVGLTVSLPDGMSRIEGEKTGWRFAVEDGRAVWRGGRIAPDGTGTFRLRAVAPDRPGVYDLVARQRYADGHSDRWSVRVTVFREGGQHLAAAAIVGAVGLSLVVAVLLLRTRPR